MDVSRTSKEDLRRAPKAKVGRRRERPSDVYGVFHTLVSSTVPPRPVPEKHVEAGREHLRKRDWHVTDHHKRSVLRCTVPALGDNTFIALLKYDNRQPPGVYGSLDRTMTSVEVGPTVLV